MCGIAGLVSPEFSEQQKQEFTSAMLAKIIHRGPEDSSVFTDGAVSLGHNRLKIIDLSDEANQPFHYDNVAAIFNGEVYNYIEIKAELEKFGFQLRTKSDTEVICAAYKHWGDDCVKHFVGMWALAIWDKTKKRLFCSRDRFGIKPFYYFTKGEGLFFASEYKALKALPFFPAEINTEQVMRGLQMSWAVFKDETYYKQLKSLRGAHNLVWHNGKITINRYWDVDFSQPLSGLSWEEKKEHFYTLFRESVKLHSRSDVQNGTCLSGGLDSSAISSMYSTLMPDATIKSFSVYYEGKGAVDERPFVREVVKKYPNIDPYYFSPSEEQIADSFHKIAYHSDVPLLGSSYISQYFLMQLAKSKGVTVVLDGQGSDEYLGGYMHSFYRVAAQQFSSFHLAQGLHILAANRKLEQYSAQKSINVFLKSLVTTFSNEDRIYDLEYGQLSPYQLNGREKLNLGDATGDKFNNFLYHLLFNTTLPTLLHYEDRNSMAFSLESRVPFLDHRLVEFAFTLNRADRINDKAETKYILREALRPVLPEAIANRKDKKGFVTPGEVKWLGGPLKFLLDIDYANMPGLRKEKIKQVVATYRQGDTAKAPFVWRLASLSYWLKNFN